MRHEMEQKMEEKIASLGRLRAADALHEEGVELALKGVVLLRIPRGTPAPPIFPAPCELYIEDDPHV
ncbi:hypothetical protein Fmac_007770 [Flemingia macrophylla]|uniref:Uncharacterized protein n=1 Tax=Flemingia macrophylla TaxID=520843 RepID=A0ABD1MXU8_9FABA